MSDTILIVGGASHEAMQCAREHTARKQHVVIFNSFRDASPGHAPNGVTIVFDTGRNEVKLDEVMRSYRPKKVIYIRDQVQSRFKNRQPSFAERL